MPEQQLRTEIKQLIVTSLKLDVEPGTIVDDAPLFGQPGQRDGLGLDSIDALELAVAIEKRYRVSIPDENVGKQAFSSVNALADFVASQRA